ncbi:MAG: cyclase family protein [Ezakiella massiliensis]
MPLNYFKSKGTIFDVRDIAEVYPLHIKIDRISENGFVIFQTGQIEKYSYVDRMYFDNHPQLSQDLIHLLCERKIRFIGVDCAGIRQHTEDKKLTGFVKNIDFM